MAQKVYTYRVVIQSEDGGGYYAYCPDLPGCFSNGRTVRSARRNMVEALRLHLEALIEAGAAIPRPTHFIQAEEMTVGLP